MPGNLESEFVLSVLIVFVVLLGLLVYFSFTMWRGLQNVCPSPYTGMPLRKASELTYYTKDKVLNYLYQLHQYDNRMFDIDRAALCRETGRIFPDAVTFLNRIQVNWNFLQKRYPGNYVSWGSLNADLKKEILNLHGSLEGFQTEFSSPDPSPRMIDPEIALKKPGPLYVDLETKVVIGWKSVPQTELEVLVVQKPKKISIINVNP